MAEKITGYTSEMCQQAMMDELEELFRGMMFTGQEGEKPLKIYKQFLPTQTDNDDDIDTNDAMYPCIIVIESSGEVDNDHDPQLVLMQLVICTSRKRLCSTSSASRFSVERLRLAIPESGSFQTMTWITTTGEL